MDRERERICAPAYCFALAGAKERETASNIV
jgi:hypothetical protein